jgi:hypothetical protein
MLRKIFSLFSLFVIPVAVLLIPLNAQSDPADPEEVAHMKAGHQKVEGVVTEVKSGLYTVKTPTGATLTLTEAAAFRQGRDVPKVGDEMTLWVNEGGERGYSLRPESRMFRDIAVGTQVTIEVNDTGEVIDIHKDKK